MNLLTIAYKSIRQRALASSLTAFSVALGVMLMVTVLVIHGVVDRMFSQTATGYDLIIGPKGSKLQLVLNAIYRVSQPIENLPYRFYRELKEDKRIEIALPLALGDTTQEGGFTIVGTIPEYFVTEYMPGRTFQGNGELIAKPFDAIIGSNVARTNGWDIGQTFRLIHGGNEEHVHDEEFTVVSVLRPTGTPNDKTVFVNLKGFYMVQGHDKPIEEAVRRVADFYNEDVDEEELARKVKKAAEDEAAHASNDGHHHQHDILEVQKEVTAILIRMKTRENSSVSIYTPGFQSEINKGFKAQAVNPIGEIKWLMDNIVGHVRTMLVVMTSLIIVVSGVSIFVSIYNSMSDRRREIAIMRALGASRQTVFSIIMSESTLLCVAGGVIGLVLGHGLVFLASPIVEAQSGLPLDPFAFEPMELVLLPMLIVLASLIGFIPGMTAYRTDVAETLAD